MLADTLSAMSTLSEASQCPLQVECTVTRCDDFECVCEVTMMCPAEDRGRFRLLKLVDRWRKGRFSI